MDKKSPCLLCGKPTGEFVGLCDLCCKVIKVKSDAFARVSQRRLEELKAGLKPLAVLLAVLCCVGPVFANCGQFTMCGSPFDHYVPENLMRLSDQAEADRQAAFWRKLRCTNTSDDAVARVTCEVDGKEMVREDRRIEGYQPEPVVIFVPADGEPQFESLTSTQITGNILPERKTDAKSKHEID